MSATTAYAVWPWQTVDRPDRPGWLRTVVRADGRPLNPAELALAVAVAPPPPLAAAVARAGGVARPVPREGSAPWLAGVLLAVADRRERRERAGHPSNAAPGVPVDGAVLRARREAVGWSQRDLAAASRVSRSLLSDIERGARARASARTRDALDQALRRAEGKGTAP